jgi:hypothetical protein
MTSPRPHAGQALNRAGPARRAGAAALAAALAALAGCTPEPPAEAAARNIVRPALGFALDAPEGWSVTDLPGYVVLEMMPRATAAERVAAAGADDARTAPSYTHLAAHVVVMEREGVALEDWADAAVRDSQAIRSDLEVLERKPVEMGDGRKALRVVLRNPRAAPPQRQEMLLAVAGPRAFGLLATGPEPELAAERDVLDALFASFVVW